MAERKHPRIIEEFRKLNLEGVLKEIPSLKELEGKIFQRITIRGEDYFFSISNGVLTVTYTDTNENKYTITFSKEK